MTKKTHSIILQCPRLHCRAILRVPETVRGKRVRCSECESTFIVPARVAPRLPAPVKPPEDKSSKETSRK